MSGRPTFKNNAIYNCSIRMKYLGLNITKHVQDLHVENYKMPMREIKDSK